MNWKKLWFGLIAIGIPLSLLAASIRWYNDAGIPQKTAPDGSEIISIQQTGPNAYRWAYLRDVLPAGQTQTVTTQYLAYGSNYYAGDTNIQLYFETNIFPNYQSSNYFQTYVYLTNGANTNVTIQQYLASDSAVSNYVITQIFQDNSVSNYISTNFYPAYTNYYTNTIGGEFIANLGGNGTNTTFRGTTKFDSLNEYSLPMLGASKNLESIANNTGVLTNNGNGLLAWVPVSVLHQTITANRITVNSNITYVNVTPITNAWANGPTGTLDLALSDQNYSAAADMDITGVINKSNNVVQNVLLTILATGANRTLYLTGAFADSTGATSYVCTNGVPREIWVRYTPALGGLTNVCSLPFYRP